MKFTDDQARSWKCLQAVMDKLNTISTEYGMKINNKRAKVLKERKCRQNTP